MTAWCEAPVVGSPSIRVGLLGGVHVRIAAGRDGSRGPPVREAVQPLPMHEHRVRLRSVLEEVLRVDAHVPGGADLAEALGRTRGHRRAACARPAGWPCT